MFPALNTGEYPLRQTIPSSGVPEILGAVVAMLLVATPATATAIAITLLVKRKVLIDFMMIPLNKINGGCVCWPSDFSNGLHTNTFETSANLDATHCEKILVYWR
jgi:hypothetical protein